MKRTHIIRALAFAGVIGCLTIGSIIKKDVTFSESENRYLASLPKLSWDNFISGKFQNELETYLSDQILGRTTFTKTKTAVSLAVGNHDINGAYVGSDGHLFEKITSSDVDENIFEQNLSQLSDFFEEITPQVDAECISVLVVPTSGAALSNKMPRDAVYFDSDKCYSMIEDTLTDYNVIDVREVLEANSEEELYYKTDHHWTSLGAYYAYTKWCQRTNHMKIPFSNLKKETVTTSFRGSIYSKVLNWNAAYDSIESYTRDDGLSYQITMDGKETQSFFDESALAKKDKYAYFFGGNYAEVCIERLATEDDNAAERNLLLIKDSFANSFVPLIAAEYDNLYMLDLRYFTGDVKRYVKSHEITDVLVLYNMSNFVSDRNIRKLAITLDSSIGDSNSNPDDAGSGDKPPVENKPQEPVSYEIITTTLTPLVKGNLIVLGDRAFEFFAYKDDMAKKYANGLNKLNEQLNGKAKVYDLLVPLSSGITFPDAYWEKYQIGDQAYAITEMRNKLNQDISLVDAYDVLMQHRKEYLYFRTDHHWTALGAYYAYTAFCKEKGLAAVPLETYQTITYQGFLGSLYREYKNDAMKNNPDYITAYVPLSDCEMTATDIYGKVTTEGILADGDTIPTADKYCVFIHGDNPYVDMHNKDLHDGSTCIVVKESFGNAFVPFLLEHYEHVIVIDYRYWNGKLADLVNQTGASDVLFVNNLYAIRNQYLLGKILGTIY